ncbi:PE-PPE domain-containing protein [Mycolicibacterium sp.]
MVWSDVGMQTPRRMAGASVLVGATAVASLMCPGARADTMLIAGGTFYSIFDRVPYFPVKAGNGDIGRGFRSPDDGWQVVDYPASLWPLPLITSPTAGRSIAAGTDNVVAAVNRSDGTVVVVGLSQGSVVADGAMAKLDADPNGPDPSQVRFIVFGDPQRGIARLVPEGTYIPLLDWRATPPADTKYDVDVIVGEYDPLSDYPDRPWNLVTDANAAFGMAYVHTQLGVSEPGDLQELSRETNSKGGTTTTYLDPAENLPLTRPLRDVGVPEKLVDRADDVLRPIVDAGYSRKDKKGDTRPFIDRGQLVRKTNDGVKPAVRQRSPHKIRSAVRAEVKRIAKEVGDGTNRAIRKAVKAVSGDDPD